MRRSKEHVNRNADTENAPEVSAAQKNPDLKKRCVRQIALCAVSLLLVVCSVFTLYRSTAWFSANDKVDGNGMAIGVVSPDSLSISVYEWQTDESTGAVGWVKLDDKEGIKLSLLQPNQSNRYLLTSGTLEGDAASGYTISGATGTFDTVRFVLEDVAGTRPTDVHSGAVNGEDDPFSYIYSRALAFSDAAVESPILNYKDTPGGGGAVPSFYQIRKEQNTYDISVQGSEKVSAQVVDLYFSKQLCSHFSAWGFEGIVTVDGIAKEGTT